MFRCFIDDSGKNPSEPVFVLGAWCGTVSAMERLSEVWDVVLHQSPRIDYYRHTEAAARVGCFKNFSVHEATSKTYDLCQVIPLNPVYGYIITIDHSEYKQFVVDRAIDKRPKLHKQLSNPFAAAFSRMVTIVLSTHYDSGFRDPIDFIFDGHKTDKALMNSIRAYNLMRAERKSHPWASLMGDIVPGDDKREKPLQAADLLAGQVRREHINQTRPMALQLWEHQQVPVLGYKLGHKDFDDFVHDFNVGLSTDILARIKAERESEDGGSKS